ncbi:hypothetical protein WJX74_006612 [Apatococcus lobatus]|uniref:Major facilitator superfamily (MFS) profile domain-containing protein n=1 Tax=Apatococcus lobatus TaxID=904363 RepID=A0AAW1Q959_9CHLO
MRKYDPTRHDTAPSWYTPVRLLALLCVLNTAIYVDRGSFASNSVNGNPKKSTGFQGEFHLTLIQDGILAAAFMGGLTVAAIIFAELSQRFNAMRLMGAGLFLWSLGCFGSGMATGFYSLLSWRIVTGIGSAGIVTLAGPFIDDIAPVSAKTLWFGMLYLAQIVGLAGGYIYGGLVGTGLGWRYAFYIQAAVGVPLMLIMQTIPSVSLQTAHDGQLSPLEGQAKAEARAGQSHAGNMMRDLVTLLSNPVIVLNLLAFCPLQAVLGAYAFWGPKAAMDLFQMPEQNVDLAFGVVTIGAAAMACLLGALAVDIMGSSVRSAMIFCGVSTLLAFVLVECSFMLISNFALFISIFAVGMILLFASVAPTSAVQVWAVPMYLRPLASGLGNSLAHLLGDVPSPPLVAWLQRDQKDWRWTMVYGSFALVLSGVLYLLAAVLRRTDYRLLRDTEPFDETLESGQGTQQQGGSSSGEGLQEPLLTGEDPPRRAPSLTLSPKRGGRPGSSSDGPDTPQLRSAPLSSPFSTGHRPGQASNAQPEDKSNEDAEATPRRGPVGDVQTHYIDLDSTSEYGSGTLSGSEYGGSPLPPRGSPRNSGSKEGGSSHLKPRNSL